MEHCYDVWHVAKGNSHISTVCSIIILKLGEYKIYEEINKYKDCEVVGEWTKSITNHMYWCAASSDGNGEEMVKRWKSLMDHLCNDHSHCYGDHRLETCVNCILFQIQYRSWLQHSILA